ncbi:E3 ubiquitin-protein ligase MARCH1 [Artemisia annua]|uniref:E3 ubiquitin-protein ligase MARCH1 n=1 Tax=Artemisia annua TaxID=35608 RepID=A0A2U1LHK8_ARTAN|nr:E3 ubiquitin-protein ligase MARCH1 [Artemisia annua]
MHHKNMTNDDHTSSSCSETEPILNNNKNNNSFSTFEIRTSTATLGDTTSDDCSISVEQTPHSHPDDDINENTSLVSPDQSQCRICLDTEGEDLIAPCHCRGTQKYVHRSCLDNWRSTREGFAFSHCTECRAAFILRANVPPDRWWLRFKFHLLVARDHAFIFVIVQLIVAFLGVLVYKFYGDELREMFGYEEHPYGFYTMAGTFNPISFPYFPQLQLKSWSLCHSIAC